MNNIAIAERQASIEPRSSLQATEPDYELSIIMPCLNEAETLETCLQKARLFLDRHGVEGEIVVGDNGSTDGSQEIARRNGARVVDVKTRGYGAALHYATLAARGRYIIIGDSDDSYDFTGLMPFLEQLRAGNDLVMGNRFRGSVKGGAMPWKNRYIGNPVLTGIGRLFFRCPAGDFHCGMRGYSRGAYAKMDLRTTGMEYASEMIIRATLMGLKIAEVATTLSPDGRSRPPHLRPWRDGWRHLVFMLLYSPRWLFLLPGMLLGAIGLALMVWLWTGPKRVGPVVLDIHTMLYAAMLVLIGFQAVAFAMFTKVFAIAEGLLPEDPRLNRVFKYITLETGVAIGLILTLLGLIGTGMTLYDWSHTSFGPLEPTRTLRRVIPSALALALGIQTLFSSFFLSLLGLRIRRMAKA